MVNESPALIRLEEHVTAYLRQNDDVGFNRFSDFGWDTLRDSVINARMTEVQVGAVETAMLVEDHIPGYGAEYIRLFMVDESRTDEEAWTCRQMLHFVFRWVAEEDRHGHVLELWLRHSGRRDQQALTHLMVTEGKKQYVAPHDNPTQLFTYTALQEKATQLFYSCLRQSTEEPGLRSVLGKLSQDEARHTHFFSQMVLDALQKGDHRHIQQIRDALEHFRMPLSSMMENYKRKAIQMMRAARGYDYRDALDHFTRLVKRVQDARTNARGTNLQDLLLFAQHLQPDTHQS